uniref:Ankyrin repeat and SOCS box containing 11 n=1 Tax=Cyclopterus lumpus TaxID=8103 RepID=A0A8C2YYI3_CYCLU
MHILCRLYPWSGTRVGGRETFLILFSCVSDFWSDRTPLHEAAYQGRLLQIRSLIVQGFHVDTLTMDRVSPLHEACLGGHYACAKFLLDNGANRSASIHTPHLLASPVHEAAKKGHRECLELLLSYGADIDMELPVVGTPLYSACMARAAACVRLLLHSGAAVRIGCGQDSPLHAAVRGGGPNVVDILLDFGADECCRNAEGKTPLDLSSANSAVRVGLQKKGTRCGHSRELHKPI